MSRETDRDATTVERAATAGVVALAAGSFALSYDALHQLAVANQVPRPLAWIWPLIVDGFIIVASLAILHAVQNRRPARYPWALLVAFSALSVAFNVLHAPPTAIARLVAAVPPLTVVLSFELLMRQLREPTPTTAGPTAISTPEVAEARLTAKGLLPAATLVAVTTAGGPSLVQRARDIQDQHREAGVKLTGKTLGQILGVSDGYARRLLRDIKTTQTITPMDGPAISREDVWPRAQLLASALTNRQLGAAVCERARRDQGC